MNNYDPAPLSVAKLEFGETHLHSFLVNTAKRNLIGIYQLESTAFILHLTNKRIILEPHRYSPSSEWVVHLSSFALTSIAESESKARIKNMKKDYLKGQQKSKSQHQKSF